MYLYVELLATYDRFTAASQERTLQSLSIVSTNSSSQQERKDRLPEYTSSKKRILKIKIIQFLSTFIEHRNTLGWPEESRYVIEGLTGKALESD